MGNPWSHPTLPAPPPASRESLPRLLVAPRDFKVRPTQADADAIKALLAKQAAEGGVLVMPFAVDIWQFVDGKWEALTAVQGPPPEGRP